ncbi:MAG: PIN domain-containing protein [Luteibacter sp.]
MEGLTFLDSNIVLYLLSPDATKKRKAIELLARRPSISVQVLNEVTNVCCKKAGMSWQEIALFLVDIRHFCPVVSMTEGIHDTARRIAARNQLSFYDASIVAAAIDSGAAVVWSEDMHDGLVVEHSVTVVNPFKG